MGQRRLLVISVFGSLVLVGCGQRASQDATSAENVTEQPAPEALPAPVNGWIEHPLKEGVSRVHATPWRTDTIEIPVPANGGDLEYKLAMKTGDALVYSTDYGTLERVDVMVSEFHGHTPKRADGVGDLMFYSKATGAAQHGQLVAPWDGIHGWYLKNDSTKDVVVTLKLAGFYELVEE